MLWQNTPWYEQVPAPGVWADAIMFLHAAVVLFVLGGLFLTLAGWWRGWRWIRNPWFRGSHLGIVLFVVLQSWFDRLCPLTIWEQQLRLADGQAGFTEGFIEYWVHQLLYYDLPAWVFVLGYTVFAILVALTWWFVPPRRRQRAAQ